MELKNKIHHGNALDILAELPNNFIQTCITGPPRWGNYILDFRHEKVIEGEIGWEEDPELFIEHLVEIFREVRRVLRDDGTCWIMMNDTHESIRDLAGIPWMLAYALVKDGWYLHSDIVWCKENPSVESNRLTGKYENLFLMTKTEDAYFNTIPIGKDEKKKAWFMRTKSYKGIFDVFIESLVERCITAGSSAVVCGFCGKGWANGKSVCGHDDNSGRSIILDPFVGSGTSCMVAKRMRRDFIGIEINKKNYDMAEERLNFTASDDLRKWV